MSEQPTPSSEETASKKAIEVLQELHPMDPHDFTVTRDTREAFQPMMTLFMSMPPMSETEGKK
jgi:hypothetical protein